MAAPSLKILEHSCCLLKELVGAELGKWRHRLKPLRQSNAEDLKPELKNPFKVLHTTR